MTDVENTPDPITVPDDAPHGPRGTARGLSP